MAVPRDASLDSSLALKREGFEFVSNRCRRLGTDAFETRLMLRTAVCMQGPEAARMFYERQLTRRGALPRPVLTLLQDRGSVMTLDGEAHRRRKQLFLSLTGEAALRRLAEASEEEWRHAVERCPRADHVVLLPAAEQILCRVICGWAGVPLGEPEAEQRARTLAALVDGAGSVGPPNLRGHPQRAAAERWAREVIRSTDGDGAAAAVFGHALDEKTAGVELLNVLRPAVAAARYVVFAAMALHEHPQLREDIASDDDLLEPFVHEVRRFYPFFPAIGGKVVEPFEWHGYRFPEGRWVLLDLYGTHRHPDTWDRPAVFRPERFVGWPGDPFTFVPQGGGDYANGHRCPGEWITVELVKAAVRALARLVDYGVPEQDLRIRPSRLPPRPESGFVMRDVRAR